MVAFPRRQRLILPIAAVAATVLGVLTALVFALLPASVLESLIDASGIASVMSAAAPPLGVTARAVLVLIGGGGVAILAWVAAYLLVGRKAIAIGIGNITSSGRLVQRRADAHPDAPPRPPVLAHRDLGTPFLDVSAKTAEPVRAASSVIVEAEPDAEERTIPANLDMPLAAFDPEAIPEAPIAWAAAPRPIRGPVTEARITPEPAADGIPKSVAPPEAVTPLPMGAPPEADPPIETSASLSGLLDRLERGVARRARPAEPRSSREEGPREEGLQNTLSSLRRLAIRG